MADDVHPEVATQLVLTEIVEKSYENLSDEETESIRQDLAARMNLIGLAKREAGRSDTEWGVRDQDSDFEHEGSEDDEDKTNLSLMNMVKRFINVRDLDIDLIDSWSHNVSR